MSKNKDQCREEFEAWAAAEYGIANFDKGRSGGYVSSKTHIRWEAWQAAWNRRPTEPQQAVALPVKPWEQRMEEYYAKGSVQMRGASAFQLEEIADWRASVQAVALSKDNPLFQIFICTLGALALHDKNSAEEFGAMARAMLAAQKEKANG